MAANLEIIEGRASMMYAADDGLPWHKDGTSVETAVCYEEALELANMNWDVELQNISITNTSTDIGNYRASVRMTDNKVLGITTPSYKIIQNREVGAFLDSLYDDGKLLYSSAGVIDNGRTTMCWLLARLTQDMRIGDDLYGRFLLASWAHDGLHSARFDVTNVRVVCENTLTLATEAKALALIQHKGDVLGKMAKARELMRITDAKSQRFQQWLETLANTEVTPEQVTAVQEKLFGPLDEQTPTQRRTAIDSFLKIYNEEAGIFGNTAYSLATAITGYADHNTRVTQKSTRMTSFLIGTSAMTKMNGLKAVASVAKVPISI